MKGKPLDPIVPIPLETLAAPRKPNPCPSSCMTTVMKSTLPDGTIPSVPKYQLTFTLLLKSASMFDQPGPNCESPRLVPAIAFSNGAGYQVSRRKPASEL